MDWTSWAGRPGPVDLEALRLLVLLHRLGDEPPAEVDSAGTLAPDQIVRQLQDERRVQCLDHLLAHPATLAYVLMDAYIGSDGDLAEQRGAVARRVRWLLANDRRSYDPARRGRRRGQNSAERVDEKRLHRFQPFVWRRWDDTLATLHSRSLLKVTADADFQDVSPHDQLLELHDQPLELRYGLTAQGAAWLDSEVYGAHGDSGFHAQVCTAIADFLPDLDDLPRMMSAAATRHCAFRRDHGLAAQDDAAPQRFHAAFRERL